MLPPVALLVLDDAHDATFFLRVELCCGVRSDGLGVGAWEELVEGGEASLEGL